MDIKTICGGTPPMIVERKIKFILFSLGAARLPAW